MDNTHMILLKQQEHGQGITQTYGVNSTTDFKWLPSLDNHILETPQDSSEATATWFWMDNTHDTSDATTTWFWMDNTHMINRFGWTHILLKQQQHGFGWTTHMIIWGFQENIGQGITQTYGVYSTTTDFEWLPSLDNHILDTTQDTSEATGTWTGHHSNLWGL